VIDLEIVRIIFVFGLLAVNSFTDFRQRVIFGNDKLYVILGAVGLTLLVIDSLDSIFFTMFLVVANITFVLLVWRFKMVASGDIIILLVVSVTLPVLNEWVILPIFVAIGASIINVLVSFVYNSSLNFMTLFEGRSVFGGYRAHIIKKFFAFGVIHQKRNWEKHVMSVQNKDSFSLFTVPFDKEFSAKRGELVSVILPFIPFMLVTYAVIVIAYVVR
jgi:hypothetical protein